MQSPNFYPEFLFWQSSLKPDDFLWESSNFNPQAIIMFVFSWLAA